MFRSTADRASRGRPHSGPVTWLGTLVCGCGPVPCRASLQDVRDVPGTRTRKASHGVPELSAKERSRIAEREAAEAPPVTRPSRRSCGRAEELFRLRSLRGVPDRYLEGPAQVRPATCSQGQDPGPSGRLAKQAKEQAC